jgi:hypothetical protein
MTEHTIDFSSAALNDACWAFINALPEGAHLNGHAWNNIKPCMKAAIEAYNTAELPALIGLPVIDPQLLEVGK